MRRIAMSNNDDELVYTKDCCTTTEPKGRMLFQSAMGCVRSDPSASFGRSKPPLDGSR